MPEYLKELIFLLVGFGLALVAFIAGAWIMYRGKTASGTGEGFLKNPKGEVFTISDGLDEATFPGSEEPSKQEKDILKNTKKFLQVLGGGSDA